MIVSAVKTKWLASIHTGRDEIEAAEELARRIHPVKVHAGIPPSHHFVLPDEANAIAVEAEARRLGLTDVRTERVKAGHLVIVQYGPGEKASVTTLAEWIEPFFVSDGTTPWYEFVFWDEASFVAFNTEAASLGLRDPLYRKELVHSRREIREAPLLRLSLMTAERGDSRPCGGTKYDFSRACLACGTGAVQTSPAMLRRSELRYDRKCEIFQTFTHFFVSPRLAEGLREAGVSGLELRQAVNIADGSPLPWHQIIASTTLPPLSDLTSGTKRSNSCAMCGMNGYYETPRDPLVLVYEREILDPDDLPDVAFTFEWLAIGK